MLSIGSLTKIQNLTNLTPFVLNDLQHCMLVIGNKDWVAAEVVNRKLHQRNFTDGKSKEEGESAALPTLLDWQEIFLWSSVQRHPAINV